jgi:hypothetical protein
MGTRGFAAFVFVLFVSVPMASAQSTGSIAGTVTDGTGGALPGATVQVTNEGTGIVRSVVADDEGRYRARELSLGEYRLEVALMGFRTAVRRGIVLTIGREAIVDVSLDIGELTEQIVVTSDAPLVDTSHGAVANLVSREQMADLPLNARDFSQLIALQAGTVHVQTGTVGASGFNAGMAGGARISISGARPSSNVFVLDGTEIQTAYGMLPSGVGGATLGLEAVQEFRVLSGNYSAQRGRSVGGTVVAASRSGTNQFRGSGYWYHRNESLDAANFFDDGEKPDFSRNQFGGALGGPILRSRTFFFGNLEHLRERLPRRSSALVPTAAAREGLLPTGTVRVAPEVKPYLALYPLPNGRDFGDGTAEYNNTANRPMDQTYASLRIDHQFTSNSSMFGRYTRDVSQVVDPDTLPMIYLAAESRNHYLTFEENQILTSRLVNQLRVAFTRTNVGSHNEPVNAPDPSLRFVEGREFGRITITGFTDLFGGEGDNVDQVDSWVFADDATFDTGRHSLHVGGAFTLMEFLRDRYGVRWNGEVQFGSLTDFLLNSPLRFRVAGHGSDGTRVFSHRLLSLYAQDDIRVTPKLTLNAGVRYEHMTAPTEARDLISNLRNILDPETTIGEPFYVNPGGFFSPRFGLAWDPTGDGTTSVRSGIGLFHEPITMKSYVVAMARLPPYWTEIDPSRAQLVGTFPDMTPHLDRLTREAPQAIHVFEYEPNNAYAIQGSLSVQRQLAPNFVVEVGYLGTRGIHLLGRKDWAVPERAVVDGESFFAPTANYVNPNFTRLHYYDTSAESWYHALRLSASKRFSDGLHFQTAYTWSKSLDTESATVGGELEGTSVIDPYDPKRDWAPSDFHAAHVFTGNASYLLPWGGDLRGVAGGFARGWQVSGVVTLSTGRPFTVSSNSQITHALMLAGNRPDLAPGGNLNPVLGGPEQYFDPLQFVPQRRGFFGDVGRNTLVGPGLVKLDFSVVKNVAFASDRRLQVRLEAFNVTNRANLAQPAATLFNARGSRLATAGRITNTSTTARQAQIAVRFEF